MVYFSELKEKKVVTENGKLVGTLKDLLFLTHENPTISKLYVESKNGNIFTISIEFIKNISSVIKISDKYQKGNLEKNDLFVDKNLLDKQIIDIVGNKLSRVNDVIIQDKDRYSILGVDVGALGILRRLGFEDIVNRFFKILHRKTASNFLSWDNVYPIEIGGGDVVMKKTEEKLERVKPEDLADCLEKTNIKNTKKILNLLGEEFEAEVVKNLHLSYQVALFQQFNLTKAAKIINLIDPEEAVDVLLALSKKKREEILEIVPIKKKNELLHLFEFSTTPLGELITTEYLTVFSETTVKEVSIKINKETNEFSFLDYIYVLNQQNQLVGVFNLHELLLRDPLTPVYKFMVQNLTIAHINTPKEIALKQMLKYHLYSLPIINNNKNLLGIVNFDDISEPLLEKI